MVRWSKEPRRISVVEGSEAASLARASGIRVFFILINETIESCILSIPVCDSRRLNFIHYDETRSGPTPGAHKRTRYRCENRRPRHFGSAACGQRQQRAQRSCANNYCSINSLLVLRQKLAKLASACPVVSGSY